MVRHGKGDELTRPAAHTASRNVERNTYLQIGLGIFDPGQHEKLFREKAMNIDKALQIRIKYATAKLQGNKKEMFWGGYSLAASYGYDSYNEGGMGIAPALFQDEPELLQGFQDGWDLADSSLGENK